jgi:predicted transcriptional regulator
MIPKQALSAVPDALRKPLLTEYQRIIQNYLERNWIASELSGGRFAEIVYTILDGHATGSYPPKPSKPADMVAACKKLEKNTHAPRSFRILIPRLLPVLYEVRNNRDVGHVGGDVNSNFMDASAVVAMVKWTLGELIRVFHSLDTAEAQQITDALAERTIPILWKHNKKVRILNNKLPWREQILLIASDAKSSVTLDELMTSLDSTNKAYLTKIITKLYDERLLEFDKGAAEVKITPKGSQAAEKLIGTLAKAPSTP